MMDVEQTLMDHGNRLDGYFLEVARRLEHAPNRLVESILYSIHAGGKRLRPTLVFEAYRACGGVNLDDPSVLSAAAAMELVHTFSLVHDDLPAMDNDDLRRGKPTNHKVYGEALAILAGDAMVTLAFEILATASRPDLVAPLIKELAVASGPIGMIGGQVLDIEGENQTLSLDLLQQIHRKKTGALLIGACRMGAICADATLDQVSAISEYGQHVGLAFQIVDDILDETSTPEKLGKATQKDQKMGKNTYPKLIGLTASRDEAQRQLGLSLSAISGLGPEANVLRALAEYIVIRLK